MTGDKLIRQIVLQAKNKPYGRHNGWIVVRLPSVSEEVISLHVKEAGERGLLEVSDVGSLDSEYQEWKIRNITAPGLVFIEDTKLSRKMRSFLWVTLTAVIIPFVGWLIHILISLRK
jgi:hypothetical protein